MSQSNTPPTPWVQPLNPPTAPTTNPPAQRALNHLPNFRTTPPGLDRAEAAAVAAAMQGEAVLEALADPAGSSGLESIARLLVGLVAAQQDTTRELQSARNEINQLRSEVSLLRQEVASLKLRP